MQVKAKGEGKEGNAKLLRKVLSKMLRGQNAS